MQKCITLMFWALVSNYCLADTGYFVCENVEGIDEWTIHVDLRVNRAGFFDNDTTSIVPLTKEQSLDTIPPQRVYFFEGLDLNGRSKDLLRIQFNRTTLTASIMVGAKGEIVWEAKDGCREEPYPEVTLSE